MHCFQWISPHPLPLALDLRSRGWGMCDGRPGGSCARLVDARDAEARPERFPPALRPGALALGIVDSTARARWLAAGFADALGDDVRLDELELKAARLLAAEAASATFEYGPVTLDLVTRDARVGARRLHLNPREFALLWRLAAARGGTVSRDALLRDVFDLGFDPGTNRVAVHICRLRKKLAHAGLGGLLVTGPGDEGYRLAAPAAEPVAATRGDRALVLVAERV
ncbi:MAG TPA: winged helix-turn-helix domain-containing protein [Novosphingobium sp.]|nr:winged helix-turn-helix domain-containing protein [Novosphingobium sp.]